MFCWIKKDYFDMRARISILFIFKFFMFMNLHMFYVEINTPTNTHVYIKYVHMFTFGAFLITGFVYLIEDD